MTYPSDLKYTESHEWAKAENDVAVIGITDYAVSKLGDIVFLELPKVGASLAKGKGFCSIESVKAVFDINSPVTGQVIEINQAIPNNLDQLKSDAYKDGWLIKAKLSNKAELSSLMDSKKYEEYVNKEEQEGHH